MASSHGIFMVLSHGIYPSITQESPYEIFSSERLETMVSHRWASETLEFVCIGNHMISSAILE